MNLKILKKKKFLIPTSKSIQIRHFFTKIPYGSQLLPVLITNNHVINRNDINEEKSILISLNNEKEYRNIKLDDSRIIFRNK